MICVSIQLTVINIALQNVCFVDRVSLYNLVNKANLVHNFSSYVHFFSIHVSGRMCAHHQEKQHFYATLGICHSVWITVWYAGTLHTSQSSIQNNTTICLINTAISPDDGHTVARNM
jgi:hypothetical protein